MNQDNEKITSEPTELKVETVVETVEEIQKSFVAPSAVEVDKAIRQAVYVSMGVGIVPMPFVNVAAATASNLHLARKLSEMYGVEFKEGVARKIIAAVIGAGVSTLATPLIEPVMSLVPIIGWPLVIGTKPVLNGATTYAFGRMFVTHFDRGGSFVGANVDSMKEDFASAFKDSREWLGNTIAGRKEAVESR